MCVCFFLFFKLSKKGCLSFQKKVGVRVSACRRCPEKAANAVLKIPRGAVRLCRLEGADEG